MRGTWIHTSNTHTVCPGIHTHSYKHTKTRTRGRKGKHLYTHTQCPLKHPNGRAYPNTGNAYTPCPGVNGKLLGFIMLTLLLLGLSVIESEFFGIN